MRLSLPLKTNEKLKNICMRHVNESVWYISSIVKRMFGNRQWLV